MADRRFEVLWAAVAEEDVAGIVDFVARESPERALAILNELERRAQSLERFPGRGRVVPELAAAGIAQYRELIVTPFRVVYDVDDTSRKVHVVAVVDARRDVRDLLLRRLQSG